MPNYFGISQEAFNYSEDVVGIIVRPSACAWIRKLSGATYSGKLVLPCQVVFLHWILTLQ